MEIYWLQMVVAQHANRKLISHVLVSLVNAN